MGDGGKTERRGQPSRVGCPQALHEPQGNEDKERSKDEKAARRADQQPRYPRPVRSEEDLSRFLSQGVSADDVANKAKVVIQECRQRKRNAREQPHCAAPLARNSEQYDRPGDERVRRAIRRHENTHSTECRRTYRRGRREDQQQCQRDQKFCSSVLPKCLAGDHPGISSEGKCQSEGKTPTIAIATQHKIHQDTRD